MDEKKEIKFGQNGRNVVALISSIIALASLVVPLQMTSSNKVPVVYGFFLLLPRESGVTKFWGTAGAAVGSVLIWLYLVFEFVVTIFAINLCIEKNKTSKNRFLIVILINVFWSFLYLVGGLVTIAFPPSRMSPFTLGFIPFIVQIILLATVLTFGDIKLDEFFSKKEKNTQKKESPSIAQKEESPSIDYSDILKTKILYTKEVENTDSKKRRRILSSVAGALGGASLMHAQNDWDYKNNRKTVTVVTFLVTYKSRESKETINAIEGSETFLQLINFIEN